jgi:hypothetical protein
MIPMPRPFKRDDGDRIISSPTSCSRSSPHDGPWSWHSLPRRHLLGTPDEGFHVGRSSHSAHVFLASTASRPARCRRQLTHPMVFVAFLAPLPVAATREYPCIAAHLLDVLRPPRGTREPDRARRRHARARRREHRASDGHACAADFLTPLCGHQGLPGSPASASRGPVIIARASRKSSATARRSRWRRSSGRASDKGDDPSSSAPGLSGPPSRRTASTAIGSPGLPRTHRKTNLAQTQHSCHQPPTRLPYQDLQEGTCGKRP